MEVVKDRVHSVLKQILSEPNYHIFINSTDLVSFDQFILTVRVDSNYSKSWFKDYCEMPIIGALGSSNDEDPPIIIQYVIDQTPPDDQSQLSLFVPTSTDHSPSSTLNDPSLNESYTFDTFVVGNNNRFANAAAIAVANKPSKAYNPLFIYGSVGIGKTHLLHAIALKINESYPKLKIKMLTSEKFTNDLINAIKDKRTNQFKDKYRHIDVFLIDDIQFLAGKEATQEEFFHTFNELYSNTKQIVMTSDRPPKDIPTLQERLRTRFGWGLIADIQPPELETRIAILRKKVEQSSVPISNEVLHYIATQIPTNVRELEGALNRISAYSSLLDTEITLSVASSVIKDMVGSHRERPLTVSLIKRFVSDFFSIPFDHLSAKTRTKDLAYARQIAMYLSRELTNMSLPKIGEHFGNRDHTTVMHACDKIKTLISSDSDTKNIINTLITNIKESS